MSTDIPDKWTDIFLVMLRNNLQLFSWILGRQSMARLVCSSSQFLLSTPMQEQVAILHGITEKKPLGRSQCVIDQPAWLFMNIHVSADRASTADSTFIMWCPYCGITFDSYLYAGVRYKFVGKLEGTVRILSELDAASDSGDEI